MASPRFIDIHQMVRPYAANRVSWFLLDFDAIYLVIY